MLQINHGGEECGTGSRLVELRMRSCGQILGHGVKDGHEAVVPRVRVEVFDQLLERRHQDLAHHLPGNENTTGIISLHSLYFEDSPS